MPDDILISELSLAPAIDDSAVFPFSQDNGGTDATFKAPMSQMAGKIAETTTYANLQTTSKTLVGAINEVAQSGGSAELIGTASGSIATFADGGNNIPCKSLTAQIVATQAGSGTPSPSNVRAITGFSSVDIKTCGENYINADSLYSDYKQSDGSYKGSASAIDDILFYIPSSLVNKQLTFRCLIKKVTTPSNLRVSAVVSGVTINGNNVNSDNYEETSVTFTPTSTSDYVFINYGQGGTIQFKDVLLYVNSEISTHTITLPETIYGGELECVGGSGKKTYGYVDLSTLSWQYVSDRQYFTATIVGRKYDTNRNRALLPNYAFYNGSPVDMSNLQFTCSNNAEDIYIKDSSYTDATTFKNSLSGMIAIYELATPTTFTTTPESIPTLSGVNNVYADSGDVDVEYFNENADEIAELIRVMT